MVREERKRKKIRHIHSARCLQTLERDGQPEAQFAMQALDGLLDSVRDIYFSGIMQRDNYGLAMAVRLANVCEDLAQPVPPALQRLRSHSRI